MNRTTAAKVRRLRAAELAAERHYGELVKDRDPSLICTAAAEWRKAAEALAQYEAMHPYSYRRGGSFP
jgi:hypothetical protein